jgi:hypothetical protein
MTTRTCVACGQVDSDPRHTTVLNENDAADFHYDCHARMGCELCASQIEGAEGLTGDALRAHLLGE